MEPTTGTRAAGAAISGLQAEASRPEQIRRLPKAMATEVAGSHTADRLHP
ncbi:hypothetical protein ACVWY0_004364 [Arthrobacter sp. UYNi723]